MGGRDIEIVLGAIGGGLVMYNAMSRVASCLLALSVALTFEVASICSPSNLHGSCSFWGFEMEGDLPVITHYTSQQRQQPRPHQKYVLKELLFESVPTRHSASDKPPEEASSTKRTPKVLHGELSLSPDGVYVAHALRYSDKIQILELATGRTRHILSRKSPDNNIHKLCWKAPHTLMYMEKSFIQDSYPYVYEVCSYDVKQNQLKRTRRTGAFADGDPKAVLKEKIARILKQKGYTPAFFSRLHSVNYDLEDSDVIALSAQGERAVVRVNSPYPDAKVRNANEEHSYVVVVNRKVVGRIHYPKSKYLYSAVLQGNWLIATTHQSLPNPKREIVIWQTSPWVQRYTLPALNLVE